MAGGKKVFCLLSDWWIFLCFMLLNHGITLQQEQAGDIQLSPALHGVGEKKVVRTFHKAELDFLRGKFWML